MNIVVFDKTETITRSLPSVTDLEILDNVEDAETGVALVDRRLVV